MLLSDLANIHKGAVIAHSPAKKQLFAHMNASKQLFKATLLSPGVLYGRFSEDYLVEMKRHFNHSYDMSENLRPYFDFISENSISHQPKIKQLADMKNSLLRENIYQPPQTFQETDIVYVVDDFSLKERLSAHDPIFVKSNPYSDETVFFIKTANKKEQAYGVFDEIESLFANGKTPADIRIVNTTDDDDLALKKLFADARVPYVIDKPIPLIHYLFVRRMLKTYEEEGFEETLDTLKTHLQNETQDKVSEALASVFDTYGQQLMKSDQSSLLRHILKNTTVRPQHETNAVTIGSLEHMADDVNQTVLIMNAHDASLPRRMRDDDYLSDDEKRELGMPTSLELNAIFKKQLVHDMHMIDDLYLFWPSQIDDAPMRPADIVLNRPVDKQTRSHHLQEHSHLKQSEYLRYAIERHKKQLYGWSSRDYGILKRTFESGFHVYDFSFKDLSDSTVERLIARGIRISATSLTTFNECPFKFFLHHVLNIAEKETNLPLFFGILSHMIMEEAYKQSFASPLDIDTESIDFPEETIQKKHRFTTCFLKEQNEILKILAKREKHTDFQTDATETTFVFPTRLEHVTLNGKIDRVIRKKSGGKDYVAVIDYKTGSRTFKDDDFEHGKAIQLPFYLLMVEKGDATGRTVPYGFFYQPVNAGKINHDDNNDPLENKLRLDGRLLDDINLFHAFYPEDAVLGIRIKNDGMFAQSSRVLSPSEMRKYLNQTQSFIEVCLEKIEKGDYRIRPLKVYGNETISPSCKYCDYQDICHHERHDWGDDS